MDDDTPSAKMLSTAGGYSQVYMIHSRDLDSKGSDEEAFEVLFRCGNWAYRGNIQIGGAINLTTTDLPLLIPVLQKQQGSLRYYCNASAVPLECDYYLPLRFLEDAVDFFAVEMISESVGAELQKMANVFDWIDEDGANTYFEMDLEDIPEYMSVIPLIASKTYTRGLVIICVYAQGTLYFVVQPGEGDQALLDVKFPDVSKHGQGLLVATYSDSTASYRKLTLWHAITAEISSNVVRNLPKLKTSDVSSSDYQQTYCIMKSSWDETSPVLSVHHDVMFRFGSWCYAGRVQLTSTLNLEDVPLIIPALRMQQSRLDFLCETRSVPTTSPFVGSLDFVSRTAPLLDLQLEQAGLLLESMMEDMQRNSPSEARQTQQWLEGDPSDSFFELTLEHDSASLRDLNNIEMVASKCYHPSGVVTVSIYYQSAIYVTLTDASTENPLLDSRFPDVTKKNRGFQIQSFIEADAPEHWPQLRKVQLWRRSSEEEDSKLPSREADSKATERRESIDSTGPEDTDNDRHLREGREGEGWIQDDHAESKGSRPALHVQTKHDEGDTEGGASEQSPTAMVVHRDFPLADEDPDSKNGASRERIDLSSMSSPSGADRAHRDKQAGLGQEDLEQQEQQPSTRAGVAVTPEAKSLRSDVKPGPGAGTTPSPTSLSSHSMDFKNSNSSIKAARPHHLPSLKLDGRLSNRMDSIRMGMQADAKLGDSGSMSAPWDASGKPLGKPLGQTPLGAKPL